MEIKAFKVTNYRSITDSGWIDLEDLTVLVGKNESGKTSLLRALHKFNPFSPEPYSLDKEWPKGNRKARDQKAIVCRVRFQLDAVEQKEISAQVDVDASKTFEMSINYAGQTILYLSCDQFPDRPHKKKITEIGAGIAITNEGINPGHRKGLEEIKNELLRIAVDGALATIKDPNDWVKESIAKLAAPEDEARTSIHKAGAEQLVDAATALKAAPTIRDIFNAYVRERIPTFIYMDDYKTFSGAARLDEVHNRAQQEPSATSPEDKTLLTIMSLSGLSLDDEFTKGSSADQAVKEQRQYDLSDAGLTLTKEIAARWRQRKYEVQFRADAHSFFTMVKDEVGEYMIPLEDRSKGFQWFFSFDLMFMHESKGDFKGCVLLLDEPGLHLHPAAQSDLLDRLEAYAKENVVIYSSHLPFMIDLRKPSRIRTISETIDNGTVVDRHLNLSQPEAKFTLQAALGMSASQSYLVAQRNIVVEGVDDFWLISEFSNLMIRSDLDGLPDDVLLTASGGASEAAYLTSFMIGQALEVVTLLDSDKAGETASDKLIKSWLTRYEDSKAIVLRMGEVLDLAHDCAIEDVFDEAIYLSKVQECYTRQLATAGANPLKLTGKDQIVKRVERALTPYGITFNKASVAKLLRREIAKAKTLSDLPGVTGERVTKLINALSKPFSRGNL